MHQRRYLLDRKAAAEAQMRDYSTCTYWMGSADGAEATGVLHRYLFQIQAELEALEDPSLVTSGAVQPTHPVRFEALRACVGLDVHVLSARNSYEPGRWQTGRLSHVGMRPRSPGVPPPINDRREPELEPRIVLTRADEDEEVGGVMFILPVGAPQE